MRAEVEGGMRAPRQQCQRARAEPPASSQAQSPAAALPGGI